MVNYDVGDVVYIRHSSRYLGLIEVGIVLGYNTDKLTAILKQVDIGFSNNKENFINTVVRAMPLMIQQITYINNNNLFDELNKEYISNCISLVLKNKLDYNTIITKANTEIKNKLYTIEGYHNYFLKNKIMSKELEKYSLITLDELLHQVEAYYNNLFKSVCPPLDSLQVGTNIMLGSFYLIKKKKNTFDIVLSVGVTENGIYRYVLVLKDIAVEEFKGTYINLKAKKESKYFLSDALKKRLGKLRSIDTNKVKLYNLNLSITEPQIETNYHYFWQDKFVQCIIKNY